MWILLAIVCSAGGQCTADYHGKFATLQTCVAAGEDLRDVTDFVCHPYTDDVGQPIT